MYLFQNACIGISAACAMALLLMGGQEAMQPEVYWTLCSLMIGLGAMSSVGSSGVRIAVEVEAVTALAGSSRATLSTLNAGFRAIDLTALLAAPMLVGAVFTWVGPAASTLLLAGYTLCAWIPETLLLRKAVHASPILKTFKHKQDGVDSQGSTPSQDTGPAAKPGPFHAIGVYLSAPTLLPGLALACLYCTVLSLGFLMTGYLNWTGLTGAEVGVYRGLGAVTGLAATALYPAMNRKLGTVTTGMLGIGYQLACLCLGTLPVILAGIGATELQPTQGLVRGLVAGVVASRTGLWIFDLAVTQLVQERVDKKHIGIVSGVQSSLSACFETMSFLAGIYFADPQLFYWLMLGSLGLVSTAFSLYTMFAIKQSCFPVRPNSSGAQAA